MRQALLFVFTCVLLIAIAQSVQGQQVPLRTFTGSGAPEGRVRAYVGDVYIDAENNVVYHKARGRTTVTGWIPTPTGMTDPHAIHVNPTGNQTATLAGHNLNFLGGHVIIGLDPGTTENINWTFGAARNAWMIDEDNPPDSNALEIGVRGTSLPEYLEYYGTQFFTSGTPAPGATKNIIGGILVLSGLNGSDESVMEIHGIDAYTYHNTSGNIASAIGIRATNPSITAGGTVTDSFNFYGALFAAGEASGINAIYGGDDPGNAANDWFAYGLGKSFFKGGIVLEEAAPSVGATQVAFGGTIAASPNCGSLLGFTACLVINVGGTTHYIPYK